VCLITLWPSLPFLFMAGGWGRGGRRTQVADRGKNAQKPPRWTHATPNPKSCAGGGPKTAIFLHFAKGGGSQSFGVRSRTALEPDGHAQAIFWVSLATRPCSLTRTRLFYLSPPSRCLSYHFHASKGEAQCWILEGESEHWHVLRTR